MNIKMSTCKFNLYRMLEESDKAERVLFFRFLNNNVCGLEFQSLQENNGLSVCENEDDIPFLHYEIDRTGLLEKINQKLQDSELFGYTQVFVFEKDSITHLISNVINMDGSKVIVTEDKLQDFIKLLET